MILRWAGENYNLTTHPNPPRGRELNMLLSPFRSSKSNQAPLPLGGLRWVSGWLLGWGLGLQGNHTSSLITLASELKKISRILTLEIFNSGARQSRNHDIPPSLFSRFLPVADQGGPPGVLAGPLSQCNGGPAVMQQGPRCTAVRALLQDFRRDFIAHFC